MGNRYQDCGKTSRGRGGEVMKLDIKPCPCCGEEKIYAGHLSATSMGVECECGLSMCIPFLEKWDGSDYEEATLLEAVRRWNLRK
jgi:hypothetical protein